VTTYEEQRKQRLMTVLSAAVRIGRAGALPDSVVAAELSDLAELYLAAAHVPYGVIGGGPAALPIHNPDFKGLEVKYSHGVDVPDALRLSILNEATKVVKERTADAVVPSPTCGVTLADYGAGEEHTHVCDKVAGHADGPGGSDHQCDACGALFTLPEVEVNP
jgi:hypothetical protein